MLARHTLLYLPAQVVAPLTQFVSIIIWAHLLSASDLGVVTLIIAIHELSFAAFFMWWSHFALRFIAGFSGEAGRRSFVGGESSAMLISAALQALAAIPVMAFALPGALDAAMLSVTSVFMLTRSLNAYMAERARAEAQIGLYTIMQVAGPLLGLLIGVALIRAGYRTPASVFVGYIAAQTCAVGAMVLMSDFGRHGVVASGPMLRRAAAFGVPVTMASMLALFAVNAPRFIVEHGSGLSALGAFSVGYGLGLRASSFAIMLVTAGAYPLAVRAMEREGVAAAYAQLSRNMTIVALVVAPVAFGLLAVNRSVVDLIVPPTFRDVTALVLPFATIGGLLRYLRAHTTDQAFLVRSRPGLITIIGLVDLVGAVVSSVVGLRLDGVAGAAAGPMVSGAVMFAVSLAAARWALGFRIPARSLVAIAGAAAIMAVIVAASPPGAGLAGLAARIALGALVYAAAIVVALPLGRRTMVAAANRLARVW
jgi:O-antigen/teichoic acid export membrane protein